MHVVNQVATDRQVKKISLMIALLTSLILSLLIFL